MKFFNDLLAARLLRTPADAKHQVALLVGAAALALALGISLIAAGLGGKTAIACHATAGKENTCPN